MPSFWSVYARVRVGIKRLERRALTAAILVVKALILLGFVGALAALTLTGLGIESLADPLWDVLRMVFGGLADLL